MNLAVLRRQTIEQACRALDTGSRFYAEDRAAIARGVRFKSASELQESLARMKAVARTTTAEIVRHCQV